ncbi:hypothetical protein DM02DRAFT_353976 [Periconia macrospinosa]|uniref:Uncharacterized protein n=1 Tax=Periconia macrospinosa TaxID=97972 RepID=A0A2V1E9D6_9PLEO|nr:hypothetical protein DM02DRAFT_353976 [Periconia macrospinosa]
MYASQEILQTHVTITQKECPLSLVSGWTLACQRNECRKLSGILMVFSTRRDMRLSIIEMVFWVRPKKVHNGVIIYIALDSLCRWREHHVHDMNRDLWGKPEMVFVSCRCPEIMVLVVFRKRIDIMVNEKGKGKKKIRKIRKHGLVGISKEEIARVQKTQKTPHQRRRSKNRKTYNRLCRLSTAELQYPVEYGVE